MRNIIIGLMILVSFLFFSCGKEQNVNSNKLNTNEKANEETKPIVKNIKLEDLVFEPVVSVESEMASSGCFLQKDFFGLSKDSIQIKFKSDNKVKYIVIVEQRSGRIVKTFRKVSEINFEYDVYFDNPFSIQIYFPKESYYNLEVSRKSGSVKNYLSNARLVRDSVIVNKKTKNSISGVTMAYKKVFNEPKKFVVSKTFSFSGEPKVYAAIEIPNSTVEFIYTLRISGENQTLSNDGQLFNNVSTISKKVKFLGLPLWESEEKGSSLSREILNSLFPPKKDEDYTLNIFFFEKQKEIKKFLNYSGSEYASAFNYDINNSAKSSTSRVGLIKKPRSGFSYIGLESTSSFSNTYAWLDVVALYEKKFNYEIRYKLVK